jgi:hypothetical protein
MQTTEAKREAIESLLPFVYAHLDKIPCAMKPTPAKWVSEPSSLDEPPHAPVEPRNCSGHCHTCRAFGKAEWTRAMCPPEESWIVTRDMLRRRYRIADIEHAIMRLADHDATLAQAVWAVWVEPWPDPRTEPIAPETRAERARLAEQGLEWLAWDIPGEVAGFGMSLPTREDQTASLMADGIKSPSVIAQRLGCSVRHAKRLKAAVMVRCG